MIDWLSTGGKYVAKPPVKKIIYMKHHQNIFAFDGLIDR